MRKTEFANGEYYHIYNRGVDKREIFSNKKDYDRMIETVWFVNDKKSYTGLADHKRKKSKGGPPRSAFADLGGLEGSEKLVEIICYCFNPNHYHFILKQIENGGISLFMSKLGNSYTKYYNTKYSRSGPLYSGKFKSIHINSNEYLLYLSAYVNSNNFIHGYDDNEDWPYCSYPDYVGERAGKLCQKEIILGQFDDDQKKYEKFCRNNGLFLKNKKESERYLLE